MENELGILLVLKTEEMVEISIQVMRTTYIYLSKLSNVSTYIVQQLKGYTSRILRKEFPKLKSRIPTLWTRSYYCESIGHISEEAVKV